MPGTRPRAKDERLRFAPPFEIIESHAPDDKSWMEEWFLEAGFQGVGKTADEGASQTLRQALELKAREELSRLEGGRQDTAPRASSPPPPAISHGDEILERKAVEELLRLEQELCERIRDDGATALACAPRCEGLSDVNVLDHYALDHGELLARLERIALASNFGGASYSCTPATQLHVPHLHPFSADSSPRAKDGTLKARLQAPPIVYPGPSSCASTSATSAQSQKSDSPVAAPVGLARLAAACAPAPARCTGLIAPCGGPTSTRLSITVLPPRPGASLN